MKWIGYIFLLASLSGWSQSILTGSYNQYFSPDTGKITVEIHGNGNYGSTIFNNEFIDVLRFGGYIDQEMKDATLARAKGLNYFGGETFYSARFTDTKHKIWKDWGYYSEFSSFSSTGLQFTKDLFELTFYGNKSTLGDTLWMRQTTFHSRSYKKLTFGLINDKVSVGISVLSFNDDFNGVIMDGYFYSDTAITAINMYANAAIYESNPSRKGFFNHAGTGIGVDFEYKIPLSQYSNDSTTNAVLLAGAKNIGFYFSDRYSQITSIDTSVTYQGIEVNGLNQFSNSIVQQTEIPDTITGTTRKGIITHMLPMEIYFYKPVIEGKKFQGVYGFRYFIQSNYRAFLYGGCNLATENKMNLSTFLSYGGYAKWQIGLSARKEWERLGMGIACNNVLGLFSKQQYGKAISLNLIYQLK